MKEAIRRCNKRFSGLQDPVAAVMQAFGIVLGDVYCSKIRSIGLKSGFPVFVEKPTDLAFRARSQVQPERTSDGFVLFENSTWTVNYAAMFDLYARIIVAKQKVKIRREEFASAEDWVNAMHAASKNDAKNPVTVLPTAEAVSLQCRRAAYQPKLFAETTSASQESVLFSSTAANAHGFITVNVAGSEMTVPLWQESLLPLRVHEGLKSRTIV